MYSPIVKRALFVVIRSPMSKNEIIVSQKLVIVNDSETKEKDLDRSRDDVIQGYNFLTTHVSKSHVSNQNQNHTYHSLHEYQLKDCQPNIRELAFGNGVKLTKFGRFGQESTGVVLHHSCQRPVLLCQKWLKWLEVLGRVGCPYVQVLGPHLSDGMLE